MSWSWSHSPRIMGLLNGSHESLLSQGIWHRCQALLPSDLMTAWVLGWLWWEDPLCQSMIGVWHKQEMDSCSKSLRCGDSMWLLKMHLVKSSSYNRLQSWMATKVPTQPHLTYLFHRLRIDLVMLYSSPQSGNLHFLNSILFCKDQSLFITYIWHIYLLALMCLLISNPVFK